MNQGLLVGIKSYSAGTKITLLQAVHVIDLNSPRRMLIIIMY